MRPSIQGILLIRPSWSLPADYVGVAVAGAEAELRLERTVGGGDVVAGEVADIGLVPGHYGPQAGLVDLLFGARQPLGAQARIVDPLFVVDGELTENHYAS
jgi:hypothetical protein